MREALSLFERPSLDSRALHGYRRERITELTVPVCQALMEGGFVGVVADKVYHVHPVLLAVISAAPMFGNLSSIVWARLARGRRKVPFVTVMQAASLALVGLVALAPAGPAGAAVLVACQIAARLLLSGIITLRSTIWSLNYPREVRARFTGRLQILTTVTLGLASLGASLALDADPQSFRLLYLLAPLVGAIGVVAYAGVPHIGGDDHLDLERGHTGEGDEPPMPTRGMWRVLRDDPAFARYQACQFVLGTSNMMIEAPLIYLVSREIGASYTVSIAITLVIPLLLATFSIPLWALYIDRVHITRFRSRQSGLWVLSQALTWFGALEGSIPILIGARVILGLARGGGSLAWQLGHNDFSNQRDLASYMGAHVTLTGVRGAFAPFLGMLLYVGSGPVPALGHSTFAVACGLSTASAVGFVLLARQIRV